MVKILLSVGLISLMIVIFISGHSRNLILKAENEFSILDPTTVGSGFCHTGYMHLFGNLAGFIVALPALVLLQPVWVLPTTFFFSCWTGSLAHVFWSEFQDGTVTQLCGASGGVYGLLTVAALSSLKTDSLCYKLWLSTVYPLIILLGYLSTQDENVSLAAHVGGVFGGLVIAFLAKLAEFFGKKDEIKYAIMDDSLHSNRSDFVWDPITV